MDGPVMNGPVMSGLVVEPGALVSRTGTALPVIELSPGQSLAITGPGGSGKSTVLAAIAGIRPAASRVRLNGAAVDPTRVGFASQTHDLVGALTAAENVAIGLLARGRLTPTEWLAVEAELDLLRLPQSSWHNLLEQLSGGQQQRVAVARALIGGHDLVCLDEPTSELDAASGEAVWNAVRQKLGLGAVVVIATSDPVLIEHCDQAITMPA
jgi:ABC-type lipoprotein export system ATPase subunit